MPKAYWVVTYRSVSDPLKLAAHASSQERRPHLLVLAFLLAATPQLLVNTGSKSAR
jgi:hypothetical protein